MAKKLLTEAKVAAKVGEFVFTTYDLKAMFFNVGFSYSENRIRQCVLENNLGVTPEELGIRDLVPSNRKEYYIPRSNLGKILEGKR